MTARIKATSLCILASLYGYTSIKNENKWQITQFQDQLLLVNNNTKTTYGKMLLKEDIEHNYKIDKVRFGL